MAPFTLRDVLAKVQGVKKSGNGYKARCPAHDDRTPSLTIAEGDDGRALRDSPKGVDEGEAVHGGADHSDPEGSRRRLPGEGTVP